jgi:hypothetical protein
VSVYTITTARDNTGIAPADCLWSACFGEFDEGVQIGTGATEADAIEDLIANHDVPWGVA